MDRSTPIKLIRRSYGVDELLQPVPVETSRTVFAAVRSISRAEFVAAGQMGMTPTWQLTMFAPDYELEDLVAFTPPGSDTEKRYSVYRTYRGRNEELELYLQTEVGTK